MARGPLAGASGPGKFSVRSDGMQLPSSGYGEGVETQAIKQGAPMAKTADAAKAGSARALGGGESITPLFAPSQRPNEPVTSGIAMGEGPGPEALGGARTQGMEEDDIRFRAAIKDYMPVLAYISDLPNTSPETRKVIRQLRDNL